MLHLRFAILSSVHPQVVIVLSSRSERGSSAGPTGGEVPGGRVSGD